MQNTNSVIRSFVRREGRFTKGQQAAIKHYWPVYGVDVKQDIVNYQELFTNKHPVVLDIGFGNGEALINTAEQHPQLNFIGVEVYRPGIGSMLRKINDTKLNNIRVINHDAVEVLKNNIASTSLASILIWFPDPWPKKRHHKRRLIQQKFLQLVFDKINNNGELHIATDWQPYAEHIQEAIKNLNLFEEIQISHIIKQRPQTKFERRGMKLGHTVFDRVYRKVS